MPKAAGEDPSLPVPGQARAEDRAGKGKRSDPEKEKLKGVIKRAGKSPEPLLKNLAQN